jgi:hypothetical protein
VALIFQIGITAKYYQLPHIELNSYFSRPALA